MISLYPDIIEKEYLIANIGKFIDEKPDTVTKLLTIFAKHRQEMFRESD